MNVKFTKVGLTLNMRLVTTVKNIRNLDYKRKQIINVCSKVSRNNNIRNNMMSEK